MHQIDLMPQRCKEVLGRRVWLRRWAIGYAVVALAMFVSVWTVSHRTIGFERERDDLASIREIKWEQNEEAQTLQKEIEDLERRIDRHNRLAWPVRISDVIDTLADSMPPQITLIAMTVTEREETIQGTAGKQTKEKKAEKRSILIVEIEGVSPDDGPVATMVSELQSVPLFRSVVLDFARNATVDSIEARTFHVTCEVDLSISYRFTQTAEVPDGDG